MSDFQKSRALLIAAMGVVGAASCSKGPEQLKISRAPGAGSPVPAGSDREDVNAQGTPKPGPPPIAFTDAEAIQFVKNSCGGCHEKGEAYQSFWSFEKGKFSAETFSVDPMAFKVYQAVKLKSLGFDEGPPAPMPPGPATPAVKFASKRFLLWAKSEVPDVVLEAHANYPDASGNANLKVNFDFKCTKPVTFRQYIRRVTNDAFEREPLPNELTWAGPSADVPTTREHRELVAAKFHEDSNWATEFRNKTLRKFTNKIASVGDIKEGHGLEKEDAIDLQNEFYELVRRKNSTMSWKEILLSNTVMVTSRTAKFYGDACNSNAPASGQWAECEMQAPRGSFFTTMGYLASKPSNFLETNNNYGRAALMSFIVSGEVLSAATDGPKGETQTKPLPTCLKTRDIRGTLSGQNFAPHGSAAVPLFGNVCQSCHISRHMASGSLLFRPFKSSGKLFSADQLVETNPLVIEATKPGQVVKDAASDASVPVTLDFLKSLLAQDGSEQACLIGNAPGASPEVVTSVKGLAERLASNDRDLAKGLARHFPRALSNLSSTTMEIQNRMIETYEKKGGKIVPLVEAYFGSETYACENRD